MVAMHNAPIAELPERTCFLSLLAEASLEHHIATKRADPEPPSLVCAEASIEAVESVACAEVTEVAEKMAPAASAPRPRSTSPPTGKAYSCKFCGRGYANTDAARKHARQQHPEWLKAQGIGCPAFYCTPMEAPSSNTATGTISPPAKAAKVDVVMATKASPPTMATAVTMPPVAAISMPAPAIATAVAVKPAAPAVAASYAAPAVRPALAPITAQADAVPPPAPSPAAAHLLMTAAESCLALSMAAHARADGSDGDATDDECRSPSKYPAKHASRADRLATFLALGMAQAPKAVESSPPLAERKAGCKRPRSVRCGKCDGCEREDCGSCKNCVDKPKFGGLGKRKQQCIYKICSEPVLVEA